MNSITAADVGRAEPSKAQETSPVLPGLADRRLTGCEEELDSENKQDGAARFVFLVPGR